MGRAQSRDHLRSSASRSRQSSDRATPETRGSPPPTATAAMAEPPPASGPDQTAAAALPSVYFDFARYTLSDAEHVLRRHARWLAAHPWVSVRLLGVCDRVEQTYETGALLAYRRALAVRRALVLMGIAEDRLIVKFDELGAIARRSVRTGGQTRNRRVDFELEIVKSPPGPVRR